MCTELAYQPLKKLLRLSTVQEENFYCSFYLWTHSFQLSPHLPLPHLVLLWTFVTGGDAGGTSKPAACGLSYIIPKIWPKIPSGISPKNALKFF